ncbi:MAG TPA: hypothetical protein VMT80_00730 [Candidatus Paceibacterota bacterium]|nr:hypothetical protein [Candidatus Paceibacterota bacterium]
MADIVKRVIAARGGRRELRELLRRKGLYRGDRQCKMLLKGLNEFQRRDPREIELVFFRPEKDEHRTIGIGAPLAYVARRLRSASLWELLPAVPDVSEYQERRAFIQEFGVNFVMFAHRHYAPTLVSDESPCIYTKNGVLQELAVSGPCPHTACWYVGYRSVGSAA